jgi:hypothetical protein
MGMLVLRVAKMPLNNLLLRFYGNDNGLSGTYSFEFCGWKTGMGADSAQLPMS